jgi:hypothetical protein
VEAIEKLRRWKQIKIRKIAGKEKSVICNLTLSGGGGGSGFF